MIRLTDKLAMTADEYGYIIGQPRTRPDKGLVLEKPKYYPTAAQAVSAALQMALRKGVADGTITTLRQFIQERARLQAELEKLVEPLN